MDFLTLALIIAVFTGLYYYFKKQLNYFEDLGIPYLPGWPILGNMAGPLLRQKHFNDIVLDLYNVHPEAKYVGGFDFSRPIVVLRDLELIKEISIRHFDNFPDHKSTIDDTVDPLFGANLFFMAGEKWKVSRSLLSPSFTSSKMKMMYELIVECTKNLVDYLEAQPISSLKMLNTRDLFTKYANDVIATCAFGISVDSLKNPNNDFYVAGKEATNMEGFQAFKYLLSKGFPGLLKIMKIKFIKDETAKFFKDVVSRTVAVRDEKGIKRSDMLQLMMDARGKESKHLKLDISQITAQAFIFFFSGFGTTSTQMCVIAHELAINPDVQKKLQDEIDDVFNKCNGEPSYETITSMPYLDAVFNESMRRHLQVGRLDRLCKSPFELPPALPGGKPFTVQPGMCVWIPAAGIHMDPKYYENPEKFDPDRYYQKKVTINDVHNLGFGIGPRGCIGYRFAVLEIKILFFYLLSKFNLKPNAKTCNPFVYDKKAFAIKPEVGYWLTIEARR